MTNRILKLAAVLFLIGAGIPQSRAAVIYAIDDQNNLLTFDSATPGLIIDDTPITGMEESETVLGMDFRLISDKKLYVLSSGGHLYKVDPLTGEAERVSSGDPFVLEGASFGFDFNPTVDRIRVTSDAGQNLRLNPSTGSLSAPDTPLDFNLGDPNQGQAPQIGGSAYINSFVGAATTTLYGIDLGLDILCIQNPPNNGALNTVGSLGVDAAGQAGFAIQTDPGTLENEAWASLNVGGVDGLYEINLATGAATLIGSIGASSPIRGIATSTVSYIGFSASSFAVAEEMGAATVTLLRGGYLNVEDSVTISTENGTGVAGSDYEEASATVVFAPGETRKTFTVTLIDDEEQEADETIGLTLSDPTGSAILANTSEASIVVEDDESLSLNPSASGSSGGGGCNMRPSPQQFPFGLFAILLLGMGVLKRVKALDGRSNF